jgi:hypothetical protein
MFVKFGSLFVISFLLFTAATLAQVAPPPMAMAEKSNIVLVDKIIEVTKHEQYFKTYCNQKVKAHALEHNWSAAKTNEILESIQFKNYNSTIYNSYAWYTTEQLKKLLDVLTLLNSDSKSTSTMVLTNVMMQGNLELFVKMLIEGKYVEKK